MELVSQYAFANMAGVTKQAVAKAIKSGKLQLQQGKININSVEAENYLRSQDATDEDDGGDSKYSLEVMKIRAQTKKLTADTHLAEMRGRTMRGGLRDARFVDEAFVQLFTSAFEQFRGIVSVLDDIIASAINEGENSRAESEQMMYDEIDKIMEGIEHGWKARIKKWNSETVKRRTTMAE